MTERPSHRALVTGASGFIGSHVVDALCARGYAVRCLVRPTSNLRWLEGKHVELYTGTLADHDALHSACTDVDYVFHLAGVLAATRAATYYAVNTQGTLNLGRAAVTHAPHVQRFVFVSSLTAAGPAPDAGTPRTEADPCRPISDYGRSKLAAEQRLRADYPGLPLTVIRPPAVYGPRDEATLTFQKFVQHGVAPLFGWGTRYLSLVYVQDLVEGLIAAAESPRTPGHAYFLAHGDAVSWQELYAAIGQAQACRYRQLHLPLTLSHAVAGVAQAFSYIAGIPSHLNCQKMREIAQPAWVCSSAAAYADFGFRCVTDLAAGLRITVDWYRTHGWLPPAPTA
jgi:nucleoside-diphosphate-sugar epimerase